MNTNSVILKLVQSCLTFMETENSGIYLFIHMHLLRIYVTTAHGIKQCLSSISCYFCQQVTHFRYSLTVVSCLLNVFGNYLRTRGLILANPINKQILLRRRSYFFFFFVEKKGTKMSPVSGWNILFLKKENKPKHSIGLH